MAPEIARLGYIPLNTWQAAEAKLLERALNERCRASPYDPIHQIVDNLQQELMYSCADSPSDAFEVALCLMRHTRTALIKGFAFVLVEQAILDRHAINKLTDPERRELILHMQNLQQRVPAVIPHDRIAKVSRLVHVQHHDFPRPFIRSLVKRPSHSTGSLSKKSSAALQISASLPSLFSLTESTQTQPVEQSSFLTALDDQEMSMMMDPKEQAAAVLRSKAALQPLEKTGSRMKKPVFNGDCFRRIEDEIPHMKFHCPTRQASLFGSLRVVRNR